jgi:class 3 adenylate cyclase
VDSRRALDRRIVQRHAGSVVEFNGDGMMAVFGAPRALRHKERAVVEAGREIVAAVASCRVERASDGLLSVGVGIATGEAFVGDGTTWQRAQPTSADFEKRRETQDVCALPLFRIEGGA